MNNQYRYEAIAAGAILAAGLGGLLIFLNHKPAKDASLTPTTDFPAQTQSAVKVENPRRAEEEILMDNTIKAEEDQLITSTFLSPATNLQTMLPTLITNISPPIYVNLRGDVISENYVPASGNGESFYSFNLRTPQGFKTVQVYDDFADYGEHGRMFIQKEVLPTRTVGIGRIKPGQYVTGTVSNVLNAFATNSDIITAPVTRIRFE